MLCVAAHPAAAHPHVFIDNIVTFVFAGGKLTGLRLLWGFDAVYSQSLIEDFDTDRDGKFSAAEIATMKKTSLTGLKPFGFFTHIWVDGKPMKAFDATDLTASRHGDFVIYDMQIKLAKPLDPRSNKIETSIFDDSYYIDVALNSAHPVVFEGLPDGQCSYKVTEDAKRAYYYDSVYPEVIQLACKG
jgi:ABC-type uncharacterized transport system substrate-binding protein